MHALAARAASALRLDSCEAVELAQRGLELCLSRRQRQRLSKLLAWAAIGKQDPFLAHRALLGLPADAIDVHLLSAYLATCNRVDEAVELLRLAQRCGQATPETTRLLADLLLRSGDSDGVLALARAVDAPLSVEDRRTIEDALAVR